ncbi:unnamed protein product [Rotaria sp. Silwood1]|nr:unnamed protein product [Rotaria sp. Silwood1]
MSVTKLESLSNEILLYLIEYYINGVDLFISFLNQLNNRFDALIYRSKRFYFDFTSIRKSEFNICMNILPRYHHIITSLTLSERDTPGQIHSFLCSFRSFEQFKKLRRLHLDFDANSVDLIDEALHSILKTRIHTLSIKGKNVRSLFEFNCVLLAILTLTRIQRFYLSVDIQPVFCYFPSLNLIYLQYLTIEGRGCTWNNVEQILKYAVHLIYLNVRIIEESLNSIESINDQENNYQLLTKLHTLIFEFIDDYSSITFDKLKYYFNLMPNLYQLEITDTAGQYRSMNNWKILFQTSLPLLKKFIFKIGRLFLSNENISDMLASLEDSFWIEKNNYQIYFITHDYTDDDNIILYYYPIDARLNRNNCQNKYENNLQVWSIGQHAMKQSYSQIDSIVNLYHSGKSCLLPTEHYFNNVKHLEIDHLNSFSFEWMTKHIDLSNITELVITHTDHNSNIIGLLIECTTSIISLQIHLKQLISLRKILMTINKSVQRLDISIDRHSFRKKDIKIISYLFPSIEHLKINTTKLDNLPFLTIYLTSLRSLTFKFVYSFKTLMRNIRQEQLNHILCPDNQYLLTQSKQSITLWIDQSTFQQHIWRSFQSVHKQQSTKRELSEVHLSKCICC